MRQNPSLTQLPDVPALAKGYLHAQSLVGKKAGVHLPDANAGAEQWDEFYKQIGWTENYDLRNPEGITNASDYGDGFKKMVHEAFQKGRLTAQQAQNVYESLVSALETDASGNRLSETAERAQWQKTLREEWGAAYPTQVSAAQRGLAAFGDPELTQYIQTAGLADFPPLVRLLAKAGATVAEAALGPSMGSSAGDSMTPDVAKGEITALYADAKFMAEYSDSNNANHAAAVEKMARLNRFAYPT